jgi:hypothetical protein
VIVAADALWPVLQQVMDKTRVKHVFLTHHGDMLPPAPNARSMRRPELLTPRQTVAGTLDFLEAIAQPGTARQTRRSPWTTWR